MITLEMYKMGRDKKFPNEWTSEIESNAIELIRRINNLLQELGWSNPQVSSGWRPAAINAATANAAKKSNHVIGKACDIQDDKDQSLANVLLNSLELLEKHELWMEDPASTKNWTHLQSVPPKSGKRVFKP